MPARKPDRTKELEGTLRPDRVNPDKPEIHAREPDPPDEITEGALRYWLDLAPKLADQKMIGDTDRHVLRQLCEALDQYDECEKIIADEGRFYESESGMKREHPASKKQDVLRKEIRQHSKKFGLSPSDRGGVSKLPEDDTVDALGKILQEAPN